MRKFKTGIIPLRQYVQFEEGNKIHFGQDFSWYEELPSNVKFYVHEIQKDLIWLIGDGYGIQSNNKFGLIGNYGSGRVVLNKNKLPKELLEWCLENKL